MGLQQAGFLLSASPAAGRAAADASSGSGENFASLLSVLMGRITHPPHSGATESDLPAASGDIGTDVSGLLEKIVTLVSDTAESKALPSDEGFQISLPADLVIRGPDGETVVLPVLVDYSAADAGIGAAPEPGTVAIALDLAALLDAAGIDHSGDSGASPSAAVSLDGVLREGKGISPVGPAELPMKGEIDPGEPAAVNDGDDETGMPEFFLVVRDAGGMTGFVPSVESPGTTARVTADTGHADSTPAAVISRDDDTLVITPEPAVRARSGKVRPETPDGETGDGNPLHAGREEISERETVRPYRAARIHAAGTGSSGEPVVSGSGVQVLKADVTAAGNRTRFTVPTDGNPDRTRISAPDIQAEPHRTLLHQAPSARTNQATDETVGDVSAGPRVVPASHSDGNRRPIAPTKETTSAAEPADTPVEPPVIVIRRNDGGTVEVTVAAEPGDGSGLGRLLKAAAGGRGTIEAVFTVATEESPATKEIVKPVIDATDPGKESATPVTRFPDRRIVNTGSPGTEETNLSRSPDVDLPRDGDVVRNIPASPARDTVSLTDAHSHTAGRTVPLPDDAAPVGDIPPNTGETVTENGQNMEKPHRSLAPPAPDRPEYVETRGGASVKQAHFEPGDHTLTGRTHYVVTDTVPESREDTAEPDMDGTGTDVRRPASYRLNARSAVIMDKPAETGRNASRNAERILELPTAAVSNRELANASRIEAAHPEIVSTEPSVRNTVEQPAAETPRPPQPSSGASDMKIPPPKWNRHFRLRNRIHESRTSRRA